MTDYPPAKVLTVEGWNAWEVPVPKSVKILKITYNNTFFDAGENGGILDIADDLIQWLEAATSVKQLFIKIEHLGTRDLKGILRLGLQLGLRRLCLNHGESNLDYQQFPSLR